MLEDLQPPGEWQRVFLKCRKYRNQVGLVKANSIAHAQHGSTKWEMQKYISNNRRNRKGTFSGQLDGCHARRSLYFGSVNYWLEPRRLIPAVSGVSKTSKLGSLSYLIILQARIWNSMMLPKPLSKVNAKVLAFQICCMKGPRKLLLL